MKICIIGTSYFSVSETAGENFVLHLAEKHPKHEWINLSIPGIGSDFTPMRIQYALEKYNPDCFILEIHSGLRLSFISELFDDDDHQRYLRIAHYKNGKLIDQQRERTYFIADEWKAGMTDKEMIHDFSIHGFDLKKSSMADFRKFFVMVSDSHRRCQVINSLYITQEYLKSLGKIVKIVEWESREFGKTQLNNDGSKRIKSCCSTSINSYGKLNLLKPPFSLTDYWMVEEGLIEIDELKMLLEDPRNIASSSISLDDYWKAKKEHDDTTDKYNEAKKDWKETVMFDGSHLNDKHLKKYSNVFDELIQDVEK